MIYVHLATSALSVECTCAGDGPKNAINTARLLSTDVDTPDGNDC